MYEAYEKKEALENVMRLIERMKDEIAGMGYSLIESEMEDLMRDVYDEKTDLDDEIMEANREQEEEDEREYWKAV